MSGSGAGSICEIFSSASSVVSCGGCSTAVGVTTGGEVASGDGVSKPKGVADRDEMVMLLPPAVNSPFPPLFLRFCGGGALTTKFRGDKAPLARKMTSLHLLQSSSSS